MGELLEDQLAVFSFVAELSQRKLSQRVVILLKDKLDEGGELGACLVATALRPGYVKFSKVTALSGEHGQSLGFDLLQLAINSDQAKLLQIVGVGCDSIDEI